ncbi:DUF2164 domain-containing protein [Roseibium aggregatum]|uniref:DUF2164 domain-containing protein n=1 Tax=Roseibium aggregatum TaxID=187304 RepID=A0A939EFM5_9HYPH|nr:DUF2164 domain-containing protein [Roseibium aggregatum]MBN9671288.1 DUF2164 domain-containing protein [Roseibium aggregatum]
MSDFELDKDTRTRLAGQIQRFMDEELDVEIGNMDAGFLIDFLSGTLGAHYYNLGLKDAQALFARKADDIVDEIYALERKPDDRG